MTTPDEDRERDFLARCVAEAYTILDIIPGVKPNDPANQASTTTC